MSTLFRQETISSAGQDLGRLRELDSHQLLGENNSPLVSFDQVRATGAWFLAQDFPTPLPSSSPLPPRLLGRHLASGNAPFFIKLALGASEEDHFPASARVIQTPLGKHDLSLEIVPIPYSALRRPSSERHTDSLLALAAVAASAPHFLFALESGVHTTNCSTKKEHVTSITPDHGTPLAVVFDGFQSNTNTLTTVTKATQNPTLTIRQATHLHGQNQADAKTISVAAAHSKIAAGVSLRSLTRSELPKHVLFLQTTLDEQGQPILVGSNDSLRASFSQVPEFGLLATALGFTAQVVGNSRREHRIEHILSPHQVDTPLHEVVRQ